MPLTKPGFPPQVSEVFEPLRNETTFLHANLEVVKELFGKQESIQILHEVAPGAFTLIRHAFRHEIIMALSRITDPKTTGKGKNAKENLTIKQLIHVIAQNCTDTAFITRLEGLEKDIETACAPFRDLRNRSIGHLDLKTILQLHPDPLPFVDLKLIENTLKSLADFLRVVLSHYTRDYFDFVPIVTGPADHIVYALSEFLRLQKLEHDQLVAQL